MYKDILAKVTNKETLTPEEISEFIKTYLPKKEEWISIKNRIIMENEHVKILTKISVDINIKNQEVSFRL